jgi:hypothetical protein
MKIAELIPSETKKTAETDPHKAHKRMLTEHAIAKEERRKRHASRNHIRSVIPITML